MNPLLDVKNLYVRFKTPDGIVTAVNDLNFTLNAGSTLGIVGESGSGKSQTAFALMGLLAANGTVEGSAIFEGKELVNLPKAELNKIRAEQISMIFQDPLASLNPRMNIGEIIAEPLKIYQPHLSAAEVKEKVQAMMLKVGLLPNLINRYPHEFSGGQCQRIGIARALIIEPKIIICDEPVSALDVSIQAQVVNLLKSLQKEMGLSLIFIAHDLAVVKHISDRVLVMYLGNAMELGSDEEVYNNTKHPYTKALMSAVPIPDPKLERNKSIELLEGELPSPINPPSGCVFRTRCLKADENCAKQKPPFTSQNNSHFVACLKVL